MRNVEQGVLSNIAQPFTAPDDPSKIAFIRMDVKDNGWIWDYFNNGTTAGAQSVDKNNGTPQYLFFNQGNLVSVLIGNRDESAFAGWIRSNVLGQPAEPASNANPAPTAPTDSSSDGSDDTQI